jgi:hypothetical protein
MKGRLYGKGVMANKNNETHAKPMSMINILVLFPVCNSETNFIPIYLEMV